MQCRRNAGFTLLEVLIAMTILAIGVLGTMELLPKSLRAVRLAAERRAISNRAEWTLGQARTVGAENFFRARRSGVPIERWSPDFMLPIAATAEAYAAAAEAYAMYTGYSTVFTEMPGAEEVYLQRVVWSARMHDGRRETFVTYITAQ